MLRPLKPIPLVGVGAPEGSDDYMEVTLNNEQSTMEPTDILLMGDEVISTTLARENDEFIKSSVDDLVPIPRESEVTSDSNFECVMPTPLPTTDVREEDFDINSPLGEQVVELFDRGTLNVELHRESARLIHIQLELMDSLSSEGDILFFEQLLNEDTSFDVSPAVLPKKSTLLVTPPPASKQFSLREVERFDLFSPDTCLVGKTEGDGRSFFWFSSFAIHPVLLAILYRRRCVLLLPSSPHIE
ncbi:hypothetical protein Tco_0674774 [Tanacetum coccineum]